MSSKTTTTTTKFKVQKTNVKGGKKFKKAKKVSTNVPRELVEKSEDQLYAIVLKNYGCNRFELYCFDGRKRIGTIRGSIKKRTHPKIDNIVLVSLRDFERDQKKCDILHMYFPDEVKKLQEKGELPSHLHLEDDEKANDLDNLIIIEDSDKESSEIPAQPKPRDYDMPDSSSEEEDEEDEENDSEESEDEDQEGQEEKEEDRSGEESEENESDEEKSDSDADKKTFQEGETGLNNGKWSRKAPAYKDKRIQKGKNHQNYINVDDI